jgi:hypothetical protein
MAAQQPRWRRVVITLVAEPPFVPRALAPRSIVDAGFDRLTTLINVVLDRIDLTQLVIDHVSVARIVDAIDVEELLVRMNVTGIVKQIITDVDLPGIIRNSTGAIASDSVSSMRLQSASADATVERWAAHLRPARRVDATRGTRE